MNNLAFVRIPKTGSTTLLQSLKGLTEHPCIETQHQTIATMELHGHAHEYFTIVRDPLQQYISCYYFVKNSMNKRTVYRPLDAPDLGFGPLGGHQLAIASTNGLAEYLLNAPIDDFTSKYLSGTLPADMVVVGEVTEMGASLALISAVTGISTHLAWENRNPARQATLQPYYVDPAVVAAFKVRNAGEYELYAKGVEHFNALKAKWL
jgi:hypothetical protein